jgi:hypothetical protein
MTHEQIRGMLGVRTRPAGDRPHVTYANSRLIDVEIPDTFDSRTNWPNCQSIQEVSDDVTASLFNSTHRYAINQHVVVVGHSVLLRQCQIVYALQVAVSCKCTCLLMTCSAAVPHVVMGVCVRVCVCMLLHA